MTEFSGWQSPGWSNPNLLINWDMRDPVNQRGQTEYILGATRYDYCLDMCNGGNIALTIKDDCINLKSDKNDKYKRLSWRCETLPKGQYTISAKIKVNEKAGDVKLYFSRELVVENKKAIVIPDAGFDGIISFTFEADKQEATWHGAEIIALNTVNNYYDIDVYAVKLETGTISTLAYDLQQPPNKAAQLRLCQRYLQAMNGIVDNSSQPIIGIGIANQENRCLASIPLIETLRKAPSLIYEELKLYRADKSVNGTEAKISHSATNSINIDIITNEPLEVGEVYFLRLVNNSNLLFSAEL